MGSYIPLSANCKERDIHFIYDFAYIAAGLIAAGIVIAVLSKV